MRGLRLGAVLACGLLLAAIGVSAAATASSSASSVREQVRTAAGCGPTTCSPVHVLGPTLAADDVAQTFEDASDEVPAWLEQAAWAAGWTPADPATDTQRDLADALVDLYRSLGEPVGPPLADRIQATAQAQPPRASAAASQLVAAVSDAVDVAGSIQANHDLPTRGELASLAKTDAYQRVPELSGHEEARLAGASTAVAESLGQPALAQADIELPLVTIGAEGDSTHDGDHVILVDASGDDTYEGTAGAGPAGVGVGVTLDQGTGDDTYVADSFSQGFSIGGLGLLVDEGGHDTYELLQFGQGFGLAGIGALYDTGQGEDVYTSTRGAEMAPIGTKAASLGGIGLLVDEGGDDRFRQDGLDGFVYGAAGGTGLMATLGEGDDTYISLPHEHELLGTSLGNFTGPIQISSEVDATAILYEEGGDDVYDCGPRVRQGCQSAAGPGALSLLLERGGNDTYTMGESLGPMHASVGDLDVPAFTMGQAAAYSLGVPTTGPGVAVLQDVDGDDTYEAESWAQGYASAGVGLLEDRGGQDTYRTSDPLVGERADGSQWLDGPGLGLGIDR